MHCSFQRVGYVDPGSVVICNRMRGVFMCVSLYQAHINF